MGKKSRLKKQAVQSVVNSKNSSLQERVAQKSINWHLIILAIIMIAGCYLRMYYINADTYEKTMFFPGKGIGHGNAELLGWDGVRYDWIATNVIEGNGYGYEPGKPDAWRPPGYPFFFNSGIFCIWQKLLYSQVDTGTVVGGEYFVRLFDCPPYCR